MTKYYPLNLDPSVQVSRTELVGLIYRMTKRGPPVAKYELLAHLKLAGDDNHVLEVDFGEIEMVRMLDEMPMHTESDDWDGIVTDHFMYRIENAKFFLDQSDAFRAMYLEICHYRLFTNSTCLDVLSFDEPNTRVVPFVFPA